MTDRPSDTAGWTPATRVEGDVRPPASKSLAIRAFLAAAAAEGVTRITCDSEAEDVRAARDVAGRLGALRALGEDRWEVVGAPADDAGTTGPDAGAEFEVRESGTLARLVTALLAFRGPAGARRRVAVAGSLARRASAPLLDALERAGVGVELLHEDPARRGWPLAVRAAAPPDEVVLSRADSSQEASGLLTALAAHAGPARRLRVVGDLPSRPYLAITRGVLERFGARVTDRRDGDDEVFEVRGPLRAPAEEFVVEPDASAAAVALAAGCLSGGAVRIPGLGAGSPQGDVRITEHLAAFGCDARAEADALVAAGAPTRGADLDLAGEPDLAPVLAAVAGVAALRLGAASRLDGLGTLDGKESRRLQVLAEALEAVGCRVAAGDDWLTVAPGARTRGPLVLDPRGDHRMAFAFALLGLEREDLRASNPGCVAKSWPGFWRDLA